MVHTEQLLSDLTDAQRQAVTHRDGPLLIVAAAGSGKTRVITRRVAWLMAQGVPAPTILAITFTNKAAGEMKQRVGQLLGGELRDFGRLDQRWPTICTFHSLCLRVLRHFASVVGLPPRFTIYDTSDQTRLIKDALKALDISSTNFAPAAVHSAISSAKNQLIGPQEYAAEARDFYARTVARVYVKYQQLLAHNSALDFDDLLLRTASAFRDHSAILAELQERFGYILIDEYQDTNHAQYIIAHALAQRRRNICVVGDPDQSIYAWRGADIRNILEFEQDYPDATVVKLEQNYRSTQTILAIAGQLIAHNTQRKDKRLWTLNEPGEKATVLLCQDEHDEARALVEQLKSLRESGALAWDDMAVFYRMNSLSRVVENALRRTGVPYVMARGVEFYNRKVIKDVLAYLRAIANPADEVSLERIVNVPPRGLGQTSLVQVESFARSQGIGVSEALARAGEIAGLGARAVTAAGKFSALLASWRAQANAPTAADGEGQGPITRLIDKVVRTSGLEEALKKSEKAHAVQVEEGDSPLANVEELISSAAEYEAGNPEATLHDYLATVSLVSDTDYLKDSGGAVTLMTLHAAKGLEFPVVAIVGLEEGLLPHARARGDLNQLEEERRLAFVGITRARRRLILTRAAYRTIRGVRERTVTSPFFGELPPDALRVTDRSDLAWQPSGERDGAADDQAADASRFRRGQLVRHPSFGIGRIAEISDMGQHTRAVVQFSSAGRKTLILQYARLEPVG